MNQIRTSALIGLGALGILFGRKMPGVQVIADEARIARYAAQPVVCNGEECRFSYVTPAQGKPVDLLLVAVKATVLDQAIADMKNFVGPSPSSSACSTASPARSTSKPPTLAAPCGAWPSVWMPPAAAAHWCSTRQARSSSASGTVL